MIKQLDFILQTAKEQGFDAAEVFFSQSESFSVNVIDGQIEDYRVKNRMGVSVRGQIGGHMGYASTENLEPQALKEMVLAAKENASLIQNPDESPLHDGKDTVHTIARQDRIAHVSAAEKIALAKEMERCVKALDSRVLRVESCTIGTESGKVIIKNSLGLMREGESSLAYALCCPVIQDGENMLSGVGYKAAESFDGIDVRQIAQEALEDGIQYIGAEQIPSAKMPVVLHSKVMSAFLDTFCDIFSADAADKGLSLLKGKEGSQVAAPMLTLVDDPFCPQAFSGEAFDGEGVATYKKNIIEDGVFTTMLYDLKRAKKAGVVSTGNASRPSYRAVVGIAPSNMYIQPGNASLSELLAQAGSGILITQVMGMHSGANTVSGDFSLAAKGFVIEGGKRGRPVEQITIAGNYYELLKGVRSIGDDLWFDLPGASCFGSPSLLVDGLSIAGT